MRHRALATVLCFSSPQGSFRGHGGTAPEKRTVSKPPAWPLVTLGLAKVTRQWVAKKDIKKQEKIFLKTLSEIVDLF